MVLLTGLAHFRAGEPGVCEQTHSVVRALAVSYAGLNRQRGLVIQRSVRRCRYQSPTHRLSPRPKKKDQLVQNRFFCFDRLRAHRSVKTVVPTLNHVRWRCDTFRLRVTSWSSCRLISRYRSATSASVASKLAIRWRSARDRAIVVVVESQFLVIHILSPCMPSSCTRSFLTARKIACLTVPTLMFEFVGNFPESPLLEMFQHETDTLDFTQR